VEVAALNAELDAIPAALENQQWHGHVHRQDYQRPSEVGIAVCIFWEERANRKM